MKGTPHVGLDVQLPAAVGEPTSFEHPTRGVGEAEDRRQPPGATPPAGLARRPLG